MAKFIITAPEHEGFDAEGKSLGMQPKRALFYSNKIGKRRVFRSGYEKPDKGLIIFKFKKIEDAKSLCEHTNKAFGENFEVEEIK